MQPEIWVYDDAESVAGAIAGRLVTALAALLEAGDRPQLCLTGGTIANRAYAQVAREPGRATLDWSRVDLWWGDERFVAADDDDRNAKQALELLAPLRLEPGQVHTMPARGVDVDLDQAASAYATELGGTSFDICLLGLGPDGHVASLFPDHPLATEAGEVIAVRNSPKPPPDRISLTLPVLNRSREVWFLVSGEDKAGAVAKALLKTGPEPVPAARVDAAGATVWLMDQAAASALPDSVARRLG